jgi:NitT/TauT family transport system ATP-binding protein
MIGLLVLLKGHKGSEDLARLADDLDLEIDEILPAVEFAEALGFLTISDGRVTVTDSGQKFLASSISDKRIFLREGLKHVPVFAQIMRALENSADKSLVGEELGAVIFPLSLSSEDVMQNVIHWGRYTELFYYDADENVLKLPKSRARSTTATRSVGV